jgi:hypothetical protein
MTVVVPGPTPIPSTPTPGGSGDPGAMTTPGVARPPSGAPAIVVVHARDPLGGEDCRSWQRLTVQNGLTEPSASGDMELSCG